jgi:hypothetical protein
MLAMLSPAEGKTMAHDDWTTVHIVAVGASSPTGSATYIQVQAGDLDGDGLPDDAYWKLHCDDGKVVHAWHQVKGPRDPATGMASGRRMHKPLKVIKDWGPSPPMLSAVKPTYDVKTLKGARTAPDGWTPITLGNADGLCEAAGAAAKTVTKTSSNIQNN